jgi:hypothetical protein
VDPGSGLGDLTGAEEVPQRPETFGLGGEGLGAERGLVLLVLSRGREAEEVVVVAPLLDRSEPEVLVHPAGSLSFDLGVVVVVRALVRELDGRGGLGVVLGDPVLIRAGDHRLVVGVPVVPFVRGVTDDEPVGGLGIRREDVQLPHVVHAALGPVLPVDEEPPAEAYHDISGDVSVFHHHLSVQVHLQAMGTIPDLHEGVLGSTGLVGGHLELGPLGHLDLDTVDLADLPDLGDPRVVTGLAGFSDLAGDQVRLGSEAVHDRLDRAVRIDTGVDAGDLLVVLHHGHDQRDHGPAVLEATDVVDGGLEGPDDGWGKWTHLCSCKTHGALVKRSVMSN